MARGRTEYRIASLQALIDLMTSLFPSAPSTTRSSYTIIPGILLTQVFPYNELDIVLETILQTMPSNDSRQSSMHTEDTDTNRVDPLLEAMRLRTLGELWPTNHVSRCLPFVCFLLVL